MKYLFIMICLVGFCTVSFSQQLQPKEKSPTIAHPPLIVLDGKVLPELVKSKTDSTKMVSPLNNIDPNDIDRIDVLKDEKAVAAYGDNGKYGVILIVSKPKKSK